VGIGTTNPDGTLDVTSSGTPHVYIQTSAGSSNDAYLHIRGARTTCTTCDIAAIHFEDNANGDLAYITARKQTPNTNEGNLLFWTTTTNGGTPTEKMRIDKDGNLYISSASIILPASKYLNFGGTQGSGSYGIRDNSGTMEYKNSGGSWTAIGGGGLFSEDANRNIVGGTNAGSELSSGTDNFFGGNAAGRYGDGSYNVGIGTQALEGTTGNTYSETVGIGHQVGVALTTGNDNIFIGFRTGYSASTASYNTLIGCRAGYNVTSGASNIIIGHEAGYYIRTGSCNVLIGFQAGYGTSGVNFGDNVVIGYDAGVLLSNGSSNVLIGRQAGDSITTGNNSICIGYNADLNAATDTNEIVIGSGVTGSGSNTVTIGNDSIVSTILKGVVSLPKQSIARAYGSGSPTTFPSDTGIKGNFNSESFDIQNEFDTTTKRFTATKAGKYLIIAQNAAYYLNNIRVRADIYKNGAQYSNWEGAVGNFDYPRLRIIDVVDLAANDYVEVNFYQFKGSNQYLSATTFTEFFVVVKLT